MTRPNLPDTTGSALKDILRRLRIVETAPQLTKASIKDGALRVLDELFGQRVKLGRLDGDFDLDGDPDWGLAIYNEAGEIVLLGTKAGLFVKGIIAASIINGSTITGGDIQTAEPPLPRVRVTDEIVNGFNAVIQFFHGAEAVDAQGYIAQADYPNGGSTSAILAIGPSSYFDASNDDRPQLTLWSRRADGLGDRLIYAIADVLFASKNLTVGEDLYVVGDLTVDAAAALGGTLDVAGDVTADEDVVIAGHLNIGTPTRGVASIRAGLALVGGAVDPAVDQVYEQAGYWTITTNAAGDGTITFPEAFPTGLLDVQVTLLGANHVTNWVMFGLHDNPTTGQIAIRIFDGATGAAVGSGIVYNLFYRALGW